MQQINSEKELERFIGQYCFYNESYLVSLVKLTEVRIENSFFKCFFEVIGNEGMRYNPIIKEGILEFGWKPQTQSNFDIGVNLEVGKVYSNGINQVKLTALWAGSTQRMYFFPKFQLLKIIALFRTGNFQDNQAALELFSELKAR